MADRYRVAQVDSLDALSQVKLPPGDYEITLNLPVRLSAAQVEQIRQGLEFRGVPMLAPPQYNPTTGVLKLYVKQETPLVQGGIAFGWSDITGAISDGISSVTGWILSPFITTIDAVTMAVIKPILIMAGVGLAAILVIALSVNLSKGGK